MATKHIYSFGGGNSEGNAAMRNELGGKGANLAEMANLGVPVPPGFTISTGVCRHFMETGGQYPEGLRDELREHLCTLEQQMGSKFGDKDNPLLLSVRSGARTSMPGMMDTVLNLGLNDDTVQGMISRTGNPRFAYDSYRRFIQMYADVVMGVEHDRFEAALAESKKKAGVQFDNELGVDDLQALIASYKALVEREKAEAFPEDPEAQLWGAIDAVFESWNGNRAVVYRRIHGIPSEWGTAVNVQSMVFGNMGDSSATGVAFTRHPATGEPKFYGEYLVNAQGEDVVAGIRTPMPINADDSSEHADESLEIRMPASYRELVGIYRHLEKHYRDMQDIEFTVQESTLWILQTRTGKRTGRAAVRIAVDMAHEGILTKPEALKRVDPEQLEQLLHPMIDPSIDAVPITTGLPASPGAASGVIAFSVEETLERVSRGEEVVLVRLETSPEDVEGMKAANAVLTARGGMTSHAAVVARGMGKCCIVGASGLAVDYEQKLVVINDKPYRSGDLITLDGTSGNVYSGALPTVEPVLDDDYHRFMRWADEYKVLQVRANADTPEDAARAIAFGAVGIGLARTEHMFFKDDRISAVRRMILASTREERLDALGVLAPMQKEDFTGIFRAMAGRPVTIRLLDPPLHEFLPSDDDEIKEVAASTGIPEDRLRVALETLHESNPMLGHRGCRLGVTFPEIYEMQARAIAEAAVAVKSEGGEVHPEIMIPLVSMKSELAFLRELVEGATREVVDKAGVDIPFRIGTMIEVPRAVVTAGEIASVADFFSFGTNDLTQMTFGFSRDDAGKFLGHYMEQGFLKDDPFDSLDQAGVGAFIRWAVSAGRESNSNLKVGICGEHGGDPASIKFCHDIGLDYVSCSPFRVPVARLAAAQAAI